MTSSRAEQVAHEDLITFLNAAFVCAGQRAFYGDTRGDRISITFLHDYVRGNYRRLYARSLALGINHFNQAEVLRGLLALGAPADPAQRAEENALITRALERLPPQRVYRLLALLRRQRVNNRRTRAVVKAWLAKRPDPAFDAVKYRAKLRSAAVHAHLVFGDERDRFLFRGWRQRPFATPLFEAFRQAHHDERALYQLPFTVAQGLARQRGIPEDRFLERSAATLTAAERLRVQDQAQAAGVEVPIDLSRAPLTKLAAYLLDRPLSERQEQVQRYEAALAAAAARTAQGARLDLGRVAVVFDRSWSTRGSEATRRRPLAVALGCLALLQQLAAGVTVHPTGGAQGPPLLWEPGGQTDLAGPTLAALATAPDLVLIVSDGFENDPPQAVDALVAAYHRQVAGRRSPPVLHLNPVFFGEDLAPRALGTWIPTVGLRDAEDLPAALGFGLLASGGGDLVALERWMSERVAAFLRPGAAG